MTTRTITLNGQTRAVHAASVADLIAEMQLDIRQIAIEQNGKILPRSTFANSPVMDADRIEIVAFIGGG